jgi:hypothetical protein
MKSLQEMKQKGRTLRAHLEAAFGKPVTLSQAYEALAAMEGAANWNVLSASLASKSGTYLVPAQSTSPLMPVGAKEVYDRYIGLPENAELMRAVCAKAWQRCMEVWRERGFQGNEFIIESTEIFYAMGEIGILPIDEDEGYSEDAENQVEAAMMKLGYHSQATRLFEGDAQPGSPFKLEINGALWPATNLPADSAIISVFDSERDGRWLHFDADHFLQEATDAQILELVPGLDGDSERIEVNGYDFLLHEGTLTETASEYLKRVKGEETGYVRAWSYGISQWTTKNRPSLVKCVPGVLHAPETSQTQGHFKVLQVMEINLVDLLNEYEVPEDAYEWQWVEKQNSFAHKGNNVEPGVWEFMVHVERALNVKETIPPLLVPFFDLASQQNMAWVLFHQG